MKNVIYTVAALSLLASGGAFAQQTLIDDINVSAEVTAACSALTASDVDFGAAGAADVDQNATSTINVTCNAGTAYTVELDYGTSPQGGTQRTVTGANPAAGEQMDYDIAQDSNFTTPWGLAADGTQLDGTGSGSADAITAYFRLHRTSGSSPGIYTDLVGVTLNF